MLIGTRQEGEGITPPPKALLSQVQHSSTDVASLQKDQLLEVIPFHSTSYGWSNFLLPLNATENVT